MTRAVPMFTRRRWRALGVGLAALLLGGCAIVAHRIVYVPIERGAPTAVAAKVDDEGLLRVVASVLVTRFDLPLTAPIRAYFYPSRSAFEQGLVREARVHETVARDQAAYAVGVGTPFGIFLRGDQLHGASLALRAGVFAHELTHISQYELAGGRRGASEQWLREGFADWVKFRAVEALGIRPYAESHTAMVNAVRQSMTSGLLPDLDELAVNRDWLAARLRLGGMATYGQAFLAADRLVERAGRRAVVQYFRHAAIAKGRDEAFLSAFAMPRAEFVSDFRRYLASLRGRARILRH